MQKSKKTLIFGYSGHALVLLESAESLGITISNYAALEERIDNPYGLEYCGNEKYWNNADWDNFQNFLIGIGDNRIRESLYLQILRRTHKKALTIIHEDAKCSKYVNIGQGTFLARGTLVNPHSTIGDNVILNTGCVVEHETKIDDHSHIGPGSVLAGNVIVSKRAMIGANSVIKEGVRIGSNSTVGAGSVVLNDVPNDVVVVGNPARIIKTRE